MYSVQPTDPPGTKSKQQDPGLVLSLTPPTPQAALVAGLLVYLLVAVVVPVVALLLGTGEDFRIPVVAVDLVDPAIVILVGPMGEG